MWSTISKFYSSYRDKARKGEYALSLQLKIGLGLAGGIAFAVMRSTGTTSSALPWILIGLGFIGALDSLGAAIDRDAKTEGLIRFLLINAIFSGIGIWLLLHLGIG